jgi:hypothetical protein
MHGPTDDEGDTSGARCALSKKATLLLPGLLFDTANGIARFPLEGLEGGGHDPVKCDVFGSFLTAYLGPCSLHSANDSALDQRMRTSRPGHYASA